jgi:hypothetical protein
MGLVRIICQFSNGAPSVERIRSRVSERSGLTVAISDGWESRRTDRSGGFSHPEFQSTVDFHIQDDTVRIVVGTSTHSYLFHQTLAALQDLGGKFDYPLRLPEFVTKKWNDRRWWQRWPRR